MLFDEPAPAAREAQRTSPVAKTEPSPAARRHPAANYINGLRSKPAKVRLKRARSSKVSMIRQNYYVRYHTQKEEASRFLSIHSVR